MFSLYVFREDDVAEQDKMQSAVNKWKRSAKIFQLKRYHF